MRNSSHCLSVNSTVGLSECHGLSEQTHIIVEIKNYPIVPVLQMLGYLTPLLLR